METAQRYRTLCPTCQTHIVRTGLSSDVFLSHNLRDGLCCTCGTLISRGPNAPSLELLKGALPDTKPKTIGLPSAVVEVIQRLYRVNPAIWGDGKIYHKQTHVDRSDLHTVQLFMPSPFVPTDDFFINIQWQETPIGGTVDGNSKQYRRELVPDHMPNLMHRLTEVFLQTWESDTTTAVLTQVQISEHLKWLRLERMHFAGRTTGKRQLTIRAQLNWGPPGVTKGTIFVPTISTAHALELMRTKCSTPAVNGKGIGKFFLNPAAAKASIAPNAKEAYLVQINCNPLALGAALVDDGLLKIGQSWTHLTLRSWLCAATQPGHEGYRFCSSIERALSLLPQDAFSLHDGFDTARA